MDVDKSLDDIINAAGGVKKGKGGGRGKGKGGGRGGAKPAGRGIGKKPAGISKPAGRGGKGAGKGLAKKIGGRGATKVVVVGGRGRGGGRGGARSSKGRSDEKTVLIGPTTDIKLSAGAVANLMREGTPPTVKAISAPNVNNAVKTLALARNYLADEGLELYAYVEFPELDDSFNSANVALQLVQKAQRSDLSRVVAQLHVSASSDPGKVAGAIASTAREVGKVPRICVSCAGPAAMLIALKANFLARRFLSDDGLDLAVVPEFENVENGPTLVHLFTLVHKPGSAL